MLKLRIKDFSPFPRINLNLISFLYKSIYLIHGLACFGDFGKFLSSLLKSEKSISPFSFDDNHLT